MKSSIALVLAAAVTLLSPGLDAWAAAGRTFESAAPATAGSPSASARTTELTGLPPVAGLPAGLDAAVAPISADAQAPAAAAAVSAAPISAGAAVSYAPAGRAVRAQEKGFLERLGLTSSIWLQKKRMPESDDELGQDRRSPAHDGGDSDELGNRRRDERNDGPDGTSYDGPAFFGAVSTRLKKGERMPERDEDAQPRRDIDREHPSNLDDLGNPSRGGADEGPDSRESGVLFSPSWTRQARPGAWLMGFSAVAALAPTHWSTAGDLLMTGLGALGFAGLGALGFTTLASGAGVLAVAAAIFPVLGMLAPPPPAPAPADSAKRVEYVVVLDPRTATLTADNHLSFVDVSARSGVARYRQALEAMQLQLDAAGVRAAGLASFGATPIATYKRINAATISVDAARAPQLKAWLEKQGHEVFDNSRRSIVKPVPVTPEKMGADWQWGSISMEENLKLMRADSVLQIAQQRFGKPNAGSLRRLMGRLLGLEAVPDVRAGVIDTGRDGSHPQLKGVAEKNMTSGPAGDRNGHGSWVTSTVAMLAPWLKPRLTHYKTFADEDATLDDILRSLTMAANDGNLVISNSWGDDHGDSNGPDSKLVRKLAEEGHIMVFAAGNAGPGADTIGSPAIVQYRDPKTGAIRVLAVAAGDRNKKIAYFSSRGDRSPMTRDDQSVTPRPDLSGQGVNVEGAWPAALGPDRDDADLGPVKAISGTSMSTPSIAGAIVLLCLLFGVTQKGAKLDAVVNAVMSTLEKTGQGRAAEGDGFINVEAAYRKLEAELGGAAFRMLGTRLVDRLLGAKRWSAAPASAVLEYSRLMIGQDMARERRRQLRQGLRLYNDDVDPMIDAQETAGRERLAELEAKYPELRSLGGWGGQLWLAARGL